MSSQAMDFKWTAAIWNSVGTWKYALSNAGCRGYQIFKEMMVLMNCS